MKRLIVLLLASATATPAMAQHAGHGQAQNPQAGQTAPASTPAPSPDPATACTPEHAAMGHCRMPAPAPAQTCTPEHAAMGHCSMPAPAPVPAQTCTPEHAAMGHCTISAQPAAPPAADPHAGHTMPAPQPRPTPQATDPHAGHQMPPPVQTPDPHAGHQMPAQPAPDGAADPHAGHDMGAAAESPQAPPVAPPPPRAFIGPEHAADLVYSDQAMAEAREELYEEHGGLETYKFLVDQLEASIGEGREGYSWDAQFWYGGDIDKFWLKTEGEGEFGGEFEGVEIQALWSRAIDPWFDLQAGARQDFGSGPDRTHLVLGVQGLAPYWFEVEGAVFLSTKGDVTARAEVEYDLRLTQQLILQPLLEADFSLQDVPELGLGSGLTTAEVGARLRYELFPRGGLAVIAPYVGVEYERAFGGTADFRRAAGEDAGGWRLLLGVRTWF